MELSNDGKSLSLMENQFWELNADCEIKDKQNKKIFNSFINLLNILKYEPEVVEQCEDEIRSCLSLLGKTKLESKKDLQMRDILFQKFSHLIEKITVKLNNSELDIPKSSLLKYPFFEKMFSSSMNESESGVIVLKMEGLNKEENKEDSISFLGYLAKGNEEIITVDNVLSLYVLAHQYGITSLMNSSIKFLLKNLDAASILPILETAYPRYPDLSWACMTFLSIREEFEEFEKFLPEKDKISDNVKEFLELREELIKSKVSVKLLENLTRTVRIEKNFEERNSNLLKKISERFAINGLEIVDHDLSESIIENFPVIDYLLIRNDQIKSIPVKWQDSLLKIDCCNCKSLTALNLSKAKNILAADCISLTDINASEAIEIYCGNSTALKNITAPKAKGIDCWNCTSITDLNVPEAKRLNCSGCTSLRTFNASKAEEIDCSRCELLTTFSAEEAKKITCSECPLLTFLSASEAETIVCLECILLAGISAQKAKEIYCLGCYMLKTIDALNAKEIYCRGCDSLDINAPEAKIYDDDEQNEDINFEDY